MANCIVPQFPTRRKLTASSSSLPHTYNHPQLRASSPAIPTPHLHPSAPLSSPLPPILSSRHRPSTASDASLTTATTWSARYKELKHNVLFPPMDESDPFASLQELRQRQLESAQGSSGLTEIARSDPRPTQSPRRLSTSRRTTASSSASSLHPFPTQPPRPVRSPPPIPTSSRRGSSSSSSPRSHRHQPSTVSTTSSVHSSKHRKTTSRSARVPPSPIDEAAWIAPPKPEARKITLSKWPPDEFDDPFAAPAVKIVRSSIDHSPQKFVFAIPPVVPSVSVTTSSDAELAMEEGTSSRSEEAVEATRQTSSSPTPAITSSPSSKVKGRLMNMLPDAKSYTSRPASTKSIKSSKSLTSKRGFRSPPLPNSKASSNATIVPAMFNRSSVTSSFIEILAPRSSEESVPNDRAASPALEPFSPRNPKFLLRSTPPRLPKSDVPSSPASTAASASNSPFASSSLRTPPSSPPVNSSTGKFGVKFFRPKSPIIPFAFSPSRLINTNVNPMDNLNVEVSRKKSEGRLPVRIVHPQVYRDGKSGEVEKTAKGVFSLSGANSRHYGLTAERVNSPLPPLPISSDADENEGRRKGSVEAMTVSSVTSSEPDSFVFGWPPTSSEMSQGTTMTSLESQAMTMPSLSSSSKFTFLSSRSTSALDGFGDLHESPASVYSDLPSPPTVISPLPHPSARAKMAASSPSLLDYKLLPAPPPTPTPTPAPKARAMSPSLPRPLSSLLIPAHLRASRSLSAIRNLSTRQPQQQQNTDLKQTEDEYEDPWGLIAAASATETSFRAQIVDTLIARTRVNSTFRKSALFPTPGLTKERREQEAEEEKMFSVDAPLSVADVYQASMMEVLDVEGQPVRFGSIFEDSVVIICFIRHFWCPLCSDYMQSILDYAPKEALDRADVKLVVIGNGSPAMAKAYKENVFQFPYDVYVDPSRDLYRALGMTRRTNDAGPEEEKGEYIAHGPVSGVGMVLKNALKMPIGRAGDIKQLGGEFIFGPGARCSYAHRMPTTRGHDSISALLRRADVDVSKRSDEPPSTRPQLFLHVDVADPWMEERQREWNAQMRWKELRRWGLDMGLTPIDGSRPLLSSGECTIDGLCA